VLANSRSVPGASIYPYWWTWREERAGSARWKINPVGRECHEAESFVDADGPRPSSLFTPPTPLTHCRRLRHRHTGAAVYYGGVASASTTDQIQWQTSLQSTAHLWHLWFICAAYKCTYLLTLLTYLTVESYTVVMLLTLVFHHPSLFHSRLKTFLFCKSFRPQPLFSSSGLTTWISRTVYWHFWAYPFFYFLVFLFSTY